MESYVFLFVQLSVGLFLCLAVCLDGWLALSAFLVLSVSPYSSLYVFFLTLCHSLDLPIHFFLVSFLALLFSCGHATL